jgi:hypothetical protein
MDVFVGPFARAFGPIVLTQLQIWHGAKKDRLPDSIGFVIIFCIAPKNSSGVNIIAMAASPRIFLLEFGAFGFKKAVRQGF